MISYQLSLLRTATVLSLTFIAGCNSNNANQSQDVTVDIQSFERASVVIGQGDFSGQLVNQGGTTSGNTLDIPSGRSAIGSLYIADSGNNRVLGFLDIPEVNNKSADFVLGQTDLNSSFIGVSSTQLWSPKDTWTSNGKLFVADTFNNRVLIWNSLPTSNVPADVVLGQPDFNSRDFGTSATSLYEPVSVAEAGGKLFVVDKQNNRVLIWNSIPSTNGEAADVVVGQPDFISDSAGFTATGLWIPTSVWADKERLIVADNGNCRVLIWNTIPTSNNTPADVVVGQSDLTTINCGTSSTKLLFPNSIYSNGTQLFISDESNNRILIYSSIPENNLSPANFVLGQSNFTNREQNDDNQDGSVDATPTDRTIACPNGVFSNAGKLFVSDSCNHRVLVFE